VDRLRGGRLADVIDSRPAGEALGLDDIAEHAEGFNVHG
jgi:hypothetical protein